MAKHKQKQGHKKRDRRDAAKLPKRIAGVKVPKSLRKGGAVRRLAASPMVRDILATALTAAAAAIAAKPASGAKKDGTAAPLTGGGVAAALAAVATDAVRQWREGQPKRDAAPDPTPHAKPASEPPVTH